MWFRPEWNPGSQDYWSNFLPKGSLLRMSNSGLLECTGYSPSLITKSSNKGQTIGEKYSGIEFLQTSGRTPASVFLLEGIPVPRIPAGRNPGSPLRSTPGPVPRTAPSPREKWKTSDRENLTYFRIWKSLTYSNRLRPALGRLYKGNLNPKATEANNDFAVTLERLQQDVPRSDELYEINMVVRELKLGLKMARDRERGNAVQLAAAEKLGNQAASLEARLRVVSNERNSALEQVSFLEATFESSANKFSDDLRRATYDAKKALADNYLDVLVSLKEKWEKKKAATDYEARLREVMANIDLLKEIMHNNLLASDDLSRLRTKEITEDLPEDFFAKVPFTVNDTGDEMKCAGGQFEDGEFDIEDFAALVGGAGCNRRLDQGPGLQLTVKNIAIFGNRKFNELDLRGFADSGHLLLSLEVWDFPKGRPRIWVVSSNAVRRGVWLSDPHEIMSTLFFGAGGGELGDSGSVSLLLLFEEPLAFRLDFGVAGSSSSSSGSSSRPVGPTGKVSVLELDLVGSILWTPDGVAPMV
ncbi:hypothetical protein F2Q70_00004491 [Brassica cretica]|uniref:Uncharacterized protein n=1 Tax=Brassica cretica TaxID=69181 RepID=A0A8S9IXA5_BRACR|nr:hypothetical protein F2Q70_00004491 [Brassica cretica]